MPLDPAVLTDFQTSLQQLYDKLNGDFWNADDATVAGVNALANAVNDALTALNQAGIAQDDATLQTIQAQVTAINQQLQDAQKEIAKWVKDMGYADLIAKILDGAIQLAAKLLK
jgi:23S rRNA maturation-related 3'-5' exoribonuclease YhaM